MIGTKKALMASGLVLLVVVLGLVLTKDKNQNPNQTPGTTTQNQIQVTPTAPTNQTTTKPAAKIINLGQDADKVYVRAIAENVTTGNCVLVFSKNGQEPIERTASLQLTGSAYTCQGFDIAKSDFPVKGTWKLKLSLSEPATALPDTRTFEVE